MFHFSRFAIGTLTDGDSDMKEKLGGKGANLAGMAKLGLPIPPGFTIPTDMCNKYLGLSGMELAAFKDELVKSLDSHVMELENLFGYTPLLSVRSGARVSMPGMMDTVLNVGLSKFTLPDWVERLGEKAAYDSYRRLLQMYGNVVFGIDGQKFEEALRGNRELAGVETDADLDVPTLKNIVEDFYGIIEDAGKHFPETLVEQLAEATFAVFDSWNTPRAIEYRKLNNIPNEWGTAVNVQSMVFGNMNDDSGSGVLFTRDPATGENMVVGEFLTNAQGEDVVAGIRTPLPLVDMVEWNASIHMELIEIANRMEEHYRDMQDMEFTVQDGKLFILQTRNGKRSAKAAIRIGVELLREKKVTRNELLSRVTFEQYLKAQMPVIAPDFDKEPSATGIPASVGVVTGKAVFSSARAVELGSKENVVLISSETTPDDIAGMNAAVGILTQTGGATSHAAVVARGMDKTCVVGCTSLELTGHSATCGEDMVVEGDMVTLDGVTGAVWLGTEVPLIDGGEDAHLKKLRAVALTGNSTVSTHSLYGPVKCVKAKAYVSVSTGDYEAAFKDWVHCRAKTLYIDLVGSDGDRSGADSNLWSLFGDATEIDYRARVEALMNVPELMAKAVVILPGGHASLRDTMSAAGWSIVHEVESIKEAMNPKGPVTMGKEYIAACGDEATAGELLRDLRKAGKKLEIFKPLRSRDARLFDILG